jgi:2,3-bisphosphoglycerate-independent phosphoglycerate mutase
MSLNLKKLASSAPVSGPVVVVVMDGVGLGPQDAGDAVHLARTPFLDHAMSTAPFSRLQAHGTAVGLPTDADMGNSEVGHNALGAGRIFSQGATRVDEAVRSGAILDTDVWRWLMESDTVHFIGLLSDGNVHSHEMHLHALCRAAASEGKTVVVHALLDGRDVPDHSALEYVDRLETVLAELGHDSHIASGGGRMFVTMDRYEADWSIVERGWNAHVHGNARRFRSAREAIETYRAEQSGISDQFLPAFAVEGGLPIRDGDAVVCLNFRGDRVLELTRAFEEGPEFEGFDRGRKPQVKYAGMMQYDGDLSLPNRYLVEPPLIDRTLGEHLAYNGITQWACSETQKFGHMTYFWNGNRSGAFDPALETYVEVPSDLIPFEQRPWMKCAEITDAAIAALASGSHQHLRLNYANGDMVGHTGCLESTILAVEAVDLCLRRLAPAVYQQGGALLITADHGNADEMIRHDKSGALLIDKSGNVAKSTSHSLAPVPFMMLGAPSKLRLAPTGRLSNVASTVLELLGYTAGDGFEPSLLTSS